MFSKSCFCAFSLLLVASHAFRTQPSGAMQARRHHLVQRNSSQTEEAAPSSSLVDASSHSWGLEGEHSGDQSNWELTSEDRLQRAQFLKEANRVGTDVCFKWHDLNCCKRRVEGGECYDNCTWTWSATTSAGAKSPKEALIAHVLHRHGIGALLASRTSADFDDFHQKNVVVERALRREGVEALTSSIEKYPDVAKVKNILLKMSLDGIRNLHSYDHTWSVLKGTGVMPRCGRASPVATDPSTWGTFFAGGLSPPANCAVQAETSEKAYLLMKKNGLTTSTRANAKERADNVENNYPASASSYYMDNAWHTGKHWIDGKREQPRIYSYSSGNFIKFDCEGHASVKNGRWLWEPKHSIAGVMCWESGGKSKLNIPISAAWASYLNALGENKAQVMMEIIDRYMENMKAGNVRYISERWLTFYAGQDAAFSATYETFREHKFAVTSPLSAQCDIAEDFEGSAAPQ